MRERRHALNCTIKKTNYFRLTALEDNATFTITKGSNITATHLKYIEYSTNEGKSWTRFTITSGSLTLTISGIALGESVILRGIGTKTTPNSYANNAGYKTIINGNKKFSTSGVIMTLLKGKWADENTSIGTGTYTFAMLFLGRTNLIDAGDLILPPDVTTGCYKLMFENCSNLTRAPELRATTLVTECYNSMFKGCLKLAYLKMLATNISASGCLSGWLNIDMPNLEFHRNPLATWWVTLSTSGIPRRCTLFDDTEDTAEEETFIDPEVYRIAKATWGGRIPGLYLYQVSGVNTVYFKDNVRIGGVAGKLLKRQIANANIIVKQFANNSLIQDMSDFDKFTGLTMVYRYGTVGGVGFYNCTNLTRITLPSTLTNLGVGYSYGLGCFANCSKLTELYIPDSVTDLNSSCFYNCTSLTSVRWSSNCKFPPNGATGITSSNIFHNCSNLEEIENFPTSTTTLLPAESFRECSKLDMSIINLRKITVIGGYALNNCNLPDSVVFNNVTDIANNFAVSYFSKNAEHLYFPKVTTLTRYSTESRAILMDFGKVRGNELQPYHFASNSGSGSTMQTIILRSTVVPTFSTARVTYIKKLYIYPSILNDFITTYSSYASKTYAIGGTEWITDFGSEDEYADWPMREYVYNTGSARIDTGICANDNTKMEIKLWSNVTGSFYSSGTRTSSSGTLLFSLTGSQTNSTVLASVDGTSTTATGFTRTSSGYTYTATLLTNGDMTYSFEITDGTNTFTADNVAYTNSLVDNELPIYLFSNGFNDIATTLRIYYVKIWQDGALVRYLRPCNVNGELCLLDMVSMDTFTSNNLAFSET